MKQGPFKFTIGQGAWQEEIRYYTKELSDNYWAGFRPMSCEDIAAIERDVGRRLPDDFKQFLGVFGSGKFPERYGGNIYDADDLAYACHGHLWMILGSGDWTSEDKQRRFYVTRGVYNPAPNKYTREALLFNQIDLLDLLQIGSNGLCCYHQVYVGKQPGPLGYCLLTPERTVEDQAPTFSEGLKTILTHHWFWNQPPDEESPAGSPFFETD